MDFRAALEAERDRAKREAVSAKARYALLRETLAKYDRMNAAAPPSAATRSHPSARSPRPRRVRGSKRTRQASGSPTKAAKIRAIVAGHGGKGITAPEVAAILSRQGSAITVNAVHAAFSKMKKAKLITSKSGKYFPTNRPVTDVGGSQRIQSPASD